MYTIQNAHDTGQIPWETTISNYYPLTVPEIEELLTIAGSTDDRWVRNDIHCRLGQGIQGLESPSNGDRGPMRVVEATLNSYYVEWVTKENVIQFLPIPVFARILSTLMNWQDLTTPEQRISPPGDEK